MANIRGVDGEIGMGQGFIDSKGSTISLSGKMRAVNLRHLLVELHKAITDRKYEDIILDFSDCSEIYMAFMLPALAIIDNYIHTHGIDFEINEPQKGSLKRLFKNTDWAHYINPNEYDRSDFSRQNRKHTPATKVNNFQTIQDTTERILEMVITQVKIDRNSLEVLDWCLYEVMDNVLNHAQSQNGGFVGAATYEKSVEFVVADAGIGIPKSLGIQNHTEALFNAIREGFTSVESNAGNGLYGTYRAASLSKGEFEIGSLNGHLEHLHSGNKRQIGLKVTTNKIPYEGTYVRCRINCEDPDLLAQALTFDGYQHEPTYSYYGKKYASKEEDGEIKDGEMQVFIRDQKASISSRKDGRRMATKLRNLLQSSELIILDFDGVNVISSNFADEVFGKLYSEMGMAFMKQFKFRNVNNTIRDIVNEAIDKRSFTK